MPFRSFPTGACHMSDVPLHHLAINARVSRDLGIYQGTLSASFCAAECKSSANGFVFWIAGVNSSTESRTEQIFDLKSEELLPIAANWRLVNFSAGVPPCRRIQPIIDPGATSQSPFLWSYVACIAGLHRAEESRPRRLRRV